MARFFVMTVPLVLCQLSAQGMTDPTSRVRLAVATAFADSARLAVGDVRVAHVRRWQPAALASTSLFRAQGARACIDPRDPAVATRPRSVAWVQVRVRKGRGGAHALRFGLLQTRRFRTRLYRAFAASEDASLRAAAAECVLLFGCDVGAVVQLQRDGAAPAVDDHGFLRGRHASRDVPALKEDEADGAARDYVGHGDSSAPVHAGGDGEGGGSAWGNSPWASAVAQQETAQDKDVTAGVGGAAAAASDGWSGDDDFGKTDSGPRTTPLPNSGGIVLAAVLVVVVVVLARQRASSAAVGREECFDDDELYRSWRHEGRQPFRHGRQSPSRGRGFEEGRRLSA